MKDLWEIEKWVDNLIVDAKRKGCSDMELAWLFLQKGTNLYFRTIAQCQICEIKRGEKWQQK